MWFPTSYCIGGSEKFFRLSMGHDSLLNYYTTNFALMHHHHYNLSDLENLIPWEKDVYIALLLKELEREKSRLEEQLRK